MALFNTYLSHVFLSNTCVKAVKHHDLLNVNKYINISSHSASKKKTACNVFSFKKNLNSLEVSCRENMVNSLKDQGLFSAIHTRREWISGLATAVGGVALLNPTMASLAFTPPPPGLRLWKDKLDGYSLFYPEEWIKVTSTGADIFFRSVDDVETNAFVEFTSPSSSTYSSVKDLGTPQEAGARAVKQYLKEFMSTRIGVRRQAKLVSAIAREAGNGQLFYDIQVNLKSFADRNEFGITPEERVSELEFDHRLFSTIGVKNSQLYELRLQTPESKVNEFADTVKLIQESFTLFDRFVV